MILIETCETVCERNGAEDADVDEGHFHGKCPKCLQWTFTEDRMPSGSYYGLCVRPECGCDIEFHPVIRGGVTENMSWPEFENYAEETTGLPLQTLYDIVETEWARILDTAKWSAEVAREVEEHPMP